MEMTPSRRRTAHLLRLLALLSSVSATAVVVVSDLASASAPKEPRPEPIAMITPAQNADELKPSPELKLTKKKPTAKRKPRIDFGRFDGY